MNLDELEQTVIGTVLYEPETINLLPSLEVDDFESFRGKAVWTAIRQLEQSGSPLDVGLVIAQLHRNEVAEAVGESYVVACSLKNTIPHHAIKYAQLLRDAAVKRVVRMRLSEVLERAKDDNFTGDEILSMATGELSRIDIDQPDDTKSIAEIVKTRMRQLGELQANGGRMTGFPTGIPILDEKIGGWQPGIVSLVAARPAMGKSSAGLATADACSAVGIGVHLFSLEDTEEAYADRNIAHGTYDPKKDGDERGVAAEKIRNGDLKRGEMHRVSESVNRLAKRKNWLVDSRSGITAEEIVRSVRRKAKDNNTKVVIVDYVQLVKRRTGISGHEALGEIITTLADAAKLDRMAYVVMSQLNREVESRTDRRPIMSDLRESGSLEERSKCIVALYRGVVYAKERRLDKGAPDPELVREKTGKDIEWHQLIELLVLKNSNGRTGTAFATWHGPTTTIE